MKRLQWIQNILTQESIQIAPFLDLEDILKNNIYDTTEYYWILALVLKVKIVKLSGRRDLFS